MYKFIKSYQTYLISFVFALAIIAGLQIKNKGLFADPDGFYHAKVSQLMQQGKIHDTFPWLATTTWKDGYADQHYLYHFLLIPFNTAEHLYISVIVFSLAFVTMFLLLLYKLKVRAPIWWTLLLLLGSIDFLFRINLVKANTLSLIWMFASFLFLLSWEKSQQWWKMLGLGLVSALFVWSYGGFVFMPIFLGFHFIATFIYKRKIDYWPVVAVGAGIVVGFLLHPDHSHLIKSLFDQLFRTGLGAGKEVPAGNEWLPYNSDWFIKSDIILLFTWVFSLGLWAKEIYEKKSSWIATWFQANTIFLLVLALLHRRFIEYYVPFAVVSSAIVFSPYLAKLSWEDIKKVIESWQIQISFLAIAIFCIFVFKYNLTNTQTILASGSRIEDYKLAADAISSHSQPGDIVLTTQWDQFPDLWYWDDKNYYLVGMDPTFMYIYDSKKYWDWRIIGDDNAQEWTDPSHVKNILKSSLNAKFVFVETSRNPHIYQFLRDNHDDYDLIYDGPSSAVFELK